MHLRIKTTEDFLKLSKLGQVSVVLGLVALVFVFICYVPYIDEKMSSHTYAIIMALCTAIFILCGNVAAFDQRILQSGRDNKRKKVIIGITVLSINFIIVTAFVIYFIYRINNAS
ncbi:hypothetical protein PATA110616_20755 [Paenibacillus tarimensis]